MPATRGTEPVSRGGRRSAVGSAEENSSGLLSCLGRALRGPGTPRSGGRGPAPMRGAHVGAERGSPGVVPSENAGRPEAGRGPSRRPACAARTTAGEPLSASRGPLPSRHRGASVPASRGHSCRGRGGAGPGRRGAKRVSSVCLPAGFEETGSVGPGSGFRNHRPRGSRCHGRARQPDQDQRGRGGPCEVPRRSGERALRDLGMEGPACGSPGSPAGTGAFLGDSGGAGGPAFVTARMSCSSVESWPRVAELAGGGELSRRGARAAARSAQRAGAARDVTVRPTPSSSRRERGPRTGPRRGWDVGL